MSQLKTKFIEDSAVTTAKIAANAVDSTKIATSVAGDGLAGGGGTALSVNVDASTIEINTDTLRVKASGITANELAANSVTTAKILDANVTLAKLASGSVDENKLTASVAGAGLTGGGGAALAVGAGDGITVNANDVAVNSTVIRTSGVNAFTADQSMGGFKLTNVATPVSGTDAANKNYIDNAINGLDWKQSVRAATTAAGTLATDFENLDTIDGITLATGDRILIKNQASGAENGIYTVNASGAPTRATDADISSEVTAGLAVFVEEGTTNADSGWVLTTDNPITLGTTALVFTQFNGAGSITAGAGLTKTGNTLDVVAGDTSILVNADSLNVNLATNSGLEVSSGLKIKSDTTTANTLAITLTTNGAGTKYDSNSFTESSESLALAAGVAGNGLALTTGVLSVNVDSTTTKITADAVEALKGREQTITLNGTDITNQYVDLAFAAYGTSASVNSVALSAGGLNQRKVSDYTVSLTGGTAGVTRLTFAGDLATAGAAELASGDILVVIYSYL